MITSLTQEQIDAMKPHRDKWIEIGLSTDRVDFEKVVVELKKIYIEAGYNPPEKFVFAKGPRDGKNKFRELYPEGTWEDFNNNLIYGSHEVYWSSYIDYFKTVVGLDLKRGDSLVEITKLSGWIWLGEDVAIIMDRPLHILMDDEGLLHSEDRPAVLYDDGFAVYSWHGQRVEKDWIMHKEKLTAQIALGQQNVELRRIACEILGWVHVLDELNYVSIHKDEDPQIGHLVEVNLPDSGKQKFIMVRCGTGRDFAIPVPDDMKTARQANAWTYGMEEHEYSPEVRT